ncbi:MAG: hypothetical protein ACE5HZ_05060 [Fidelibacterota bacterium]
MTRKKDSKKTKFRKSLRQSTHPIPPGHVEESKKGYDRSRSKRKAEEEIEKETHEKSEEEDSG